MSVGWIMINIPLWQHNTSALDLTVKYRNSRQTAIIWHAQSWAHSSSVCISNGKVDLCVCMWVCLRHNSCQQNPLDLVTQAVLPQSQRPVEKKIIFKEYFYFVCLISNSWVDCYGFFLDLIVLRIHFEMLLVLVNLELSGFHLFLQSG